MLHFFSTSTREIHRSSCGQISWHFCTILLVFAILPRPSTADRVTLDDGRVLDTPDDLKQAFEHAIQTELALKGFDLTPVLTIFRSKDGEVENLGDDAEDDEEMFACEICDGLVKESDNECPHCGAMFEDEEVEVAESPKKGGPPGPSSGPPGPSKSGGPPKKSGGPPGPSKSGGPPKRSGPPKGGPGGGPPGPKRGPR